MNRIALIKLLELVAPALSKTDLVPVFTHYMFCDGAVSASNDALTIVAKSKIVKTEGSVLALQGATLLGLLKNTDVEDVTFEQGTEYDCVVKAGRSTFKLAFLPEGDFLFAEPKKEKWDVSISLDPHLLKGIEICLITASTDNAAAAIMGVCFNTTKGLTLYSCDGDALTKYNPLSLYEGSGSFTVPSNFCEAVLKICTETEAIKGKLEINERWAKATIEGGFTVYGLMNENKKPLDHADLLDKTLTGKTKFVPLPEGFNEALSRARVLADIESKPTSLTVKGNKIALLTETSIGSVNDELSIKGHDPVTALVHASLVQKAAAICNKIAIRENCTAYQLDDTVLQVVSNIGE